MKINIMKKLVFAILAAGLLAFSSCASSKPCPAYAKAVDAKEIRG
jgi:hypothetical protein